jgi:hypothetical protein
MKPIFRSAITDENGDVDVGYLALIWGLIGWGVAVGVVLTAGGFSVYRHPDKAAEIIQSIGVAVGAVSGGFATMLGAVGLFRMGDKPHAEPIPPPGKTTTTETTTETVTGTPQIGPVGNPLRVAVVDMPPADKPSAKARKRGR